MTQQQDASLAAISQRDVMNAIHTLRKRCPEHPQPGHIVYNIHGYTLELGEPSPTEGGAYTSHNLTTNQPSFIPYYITYSPTSPWVYLAANRAEYDQLLKAGHTTEYHHGYEEGYNDGYDAATSEHMPDPNTNLLELLQRTAHYPTIYANSPENYQRAKDILSRITPAEPTPEDLADPIDFDQIKRPF